MRFKFVLDAVHVGPNGIGFRGLGNASFHISGALFRRASRRDRRASSAAKKPRFRRTEKEKGDRDYGHSLIQDGQGKGGDHGE